MGPRPHDPQVLPIADVTDEWVVRCECGCGLYEQFAQREEALSRADAAADDGAANGTANGAAPATGDGVDHTDTAGGVPEPI